ncbi:MAG: tryptophan 7-halogenase [Gammaproteobacteria bacterium]|nr:tryptophan 7-halogenase [Gammaproteobacteria bacterium]
MSLSPDVLIIGGGPAGSTIGTFLARKGRKVVLLEKDEHPRFHIGESLLPMNLPILERLGALEQMKKIGVVKRGADFTYGDDPLVYRTYNFDRALGESPDHAFEVKRETFDYMLFENCQQAGVETHQKHKVLKTELDPGGAHRVYSQDTEGNEHQWTPRFLIDASGRDAFMAAANGWKRKNSMHASAAIFGHFKGVQRRPGNNAGNISLYWFPHGWLWMIPLQDDLMSIGAVCWPEYLKQRRGETENFFWKTLALCPAAHKRVVNAQAVAPVRVTGNYSYRAARMSGNGYLLVGDAFAFIDPVFSSGVYLAMNSAEGGVPIVEHWLNGERREFASACRRFERRTRTGLRAYSWFIYRFTSPAMRNLFKAPRNVMQVEQAVISMLAGDVFANRNVQLRLILFRMIYSVSWLMRLKESFFARRRRLHNATLTFNDSENVI